MVYLDYAATTPYNKDVLKTYTQLLEKYFYNADSIYSQGIEVNRLLEKSRGLLAKMLDVDEEEMIFNMFPSILILKELLFNIKIEGNILSQLR